MNIVFSGSKDELKERVSERAEDFTGRKRNDK